MYNIKVFDDTVPFNIQKAAYDYCLTQRIYSGYRMLPGLDSVPLVEPFNDVHPPVADRTIGRAPFASCAEDLKYHPPIQELFNYINANVFDGKLKLDGLLESSPGLHYPSREYVFSDATATTNVQFDDPSKPWTQRITQNGSIAYLQTHPYETVRTQRIPHRDWKGGYDMADNNNNYFTLMFVANLVWKPEWFGEFTMFEDAQEDIQGANYEDLKVNRRVKIGWPSNMIENVPGRIVLQDGRHLHASRAVGETAPEPTMHINFRVSLSD